MSVFGITLSDYGPEALVALFIILIFLGVWVPGREARRWQQAAERSADQVDQLIESLEPILAVIRSLKEQTGEKPKQGGDPS
jgi:hypothetical protein